MTNSIYEKKTGSFYTPLKTISFMRDFLSSQGVLPRLVLEPCFGDGRFVDIFEGIDAVESIHAVEISEKKTSHLQERQRSQKITLITSDFLDYADKTNHKFDLIVGNPPYINISSMERDFLQKARSVCEEYDLPENVIQNAWVAFLLFSVNLLNDNGAIFFVLPLEFLQVQYAEKIREMLEEKFAKIHIFQFSERMFPDIEQEVCLVYLSRRQGNGASIILRQYCKLDSRIPQIESKIERNKPLKKWTNAILSDCDIDLLLASDKQIDHIRDIGDSSPGIVTGANNELILSEQEVKQYKCADYVLPIIAKGKMAHGRFEIGDSLFDALAENGEKVYLLNLREVNIDNLPRELTEYLNEAKNVVRRGRRVIDSYKCANRDPWFGVPITKKGDISFFRRYDLFPRFCVNVSEIYTSDVAYNIRLHDGYKPSSMAFSFYNSLTLAQAEFQGRYYGGGVSELTPSEFKSLHIPYREISDTDIAELKGMIEDDNASIGEVAQFVNEKVLMNHFTKEQIERLEDIREILYQRRKH